MRKAAGRIALSVLTMSALVGAGAAGQATASPAKGAAQDYVVLYARGASAEAAQAAIAKAGGQIVKVNAAVGLATVTSTDTAFLTNVRGESALAGAARNKPIGHAPKLQPKFDAAAEAGTAAARSVQASDLGEDPLENLQWDMRMIHTREAQATQPGSKQVLVGILDTGIDASHPDIAPNFSWDLSRNFTTDVPLVDGPCEDEPDQSCSDPAWVDEGGHGTHVASEVGSPRNGIGMVGVAPNVTLVNLRAGQDSGYFFLQPSVDALTYAGDHGIDVVNMSYFIDPWLYNCQDNPADSPEEQMEQRTIVAATNRALDYAFNRGVALVSASGNEHTDLGKIFADDISPDFPPGTERHRDVDNATCLSMPTEGNNVMSVNSIGPSTTKADYSNYGLEQSTVAAPGGWFRDGFGTPSYRTNENLILAAWPKALLLEDGSIDEDGNVFNPAVRKSCADGQCAYYLYIQGTSMASPHATGVAALIISEYGHLDAQHGGLTLKPKKTEKILRATATNTPCPVPPLQSYVREGRPASFDALCEGTADFNGFYGDGIVDAFGAVN